MARASVAGDQPQGGHAWDRIAFDVCLGGVVVLGFIGLSACGAGETATSDSGSASTAAVAGTAATQTVTPGPVVDAITVTSKNFVQAMSEAGIPCAQVDDGFTCAVNGVEIGVGVPRDWIADERLRSRACDEGYINTEYQVVGDDESWYAAIDYHDDGVALVDALAAAGYVTGFFDYCPSK